MNKNHQAVSTNKSIRLILYIYLGEILHPHKFVPVSRRNFPYPMQNWYWRNFVCTQNCYTCIWEKFCVPHAKLVWRNFVFPVQNSSYIQYIGEILCTMCKIIYILNGVHKLAPSYVFVYIYIGTNLCRAHKICAYYVLCVDKTITYATPNSTIPSIKDSYLKKKKSKP